MRVVEAAGLSTVLDCVVTGVDLLLVVFTLLRVSTSGVALLVLVSVVLGCDVAS